MTSERGFYGWKLVFFLWLLDFLNMGFPLYGGAVINTYMLKEIPMSRSAFGMGFTILNLFVGIPSILVGASIVRWGIRRTFGIGFGADSRRRTVALPDRFETLALLDGIWSAHGHGNQLWHDHSGGHGHHAMVRPLSGKNHGSDAIGIGICGVFIAPLINRILTANGGNWRQAWAIVAGMAVVSAIVAFLFVRERPEDLGQSVDGGPGAASSAKSTSASCPRF